MKQKRMSSEVRAGIQGLISMPLCYDSESNSQESTLHLIN